MTTTGPDSAMSSGFRSRRSPQNLRVGLAGYFGPGLQTVINTLSEVRERDIVEDQQDRVMRGGSFYLHPVAGTIRLPR